jgi:predicted CXXCH cytochrome family protein
LSIPRTPEEIMTSRNIPLLLLAIMSVPSLSVAQPADGGYTGSEACRECHEGTYDRWKTTLMANILQDPREHPEIVVGDFSKPNDIVDFDLGDVAFTYGSKWKQRYFTKKGDDYFVLPAQWDVKNRVWRPYHPGPGGDWWVPFYPDDQMQRPTGPLCDGCHSVNYDIQTKQVTEWNVGCEKCHGPGAEHVRNPSITNIVNPARLDHVRGNDVCIQCHSQGQPPDNPIDGVYYDWPVGYEPGDRLSEYWHLEEHRLGEESFTHWPDGSAHKNRMQGNDFVQSVMYKKGISCWSCHDVHGTGHEAELIKPPNATCLTCHGPDSPAGPRGQSVAAHSHHSEENAQCIDCHMPAIDKTVADVNVRSHTFRFISPSMTEQYGIPNPCTSCHTDISDEEVMTELESWKNFSPWRFQ